MSIVQVAHRAACDVPEECTCRSDSSTSAGSVTSSLPPSPRRSSAEEGAAEATAQADASIVAVEAAAESIAERAAEPEESTTESDEEPTVRRGTLAIPREIFGKRKTMEVTLGKIKDSPQYKIDVGNGKKLGEGMFGTVRLIMALQKSTAAVERAVKIVNINHAKRVGVRRQSLNQELLIHSEASDAQRDLSALQPPVLTPPSHPLIVKLHEVFSDNNEVSIVMERLGRNISEFMQSCRVVIVMKARRWAGELASALHFLHNMQLVAHRDVKSENILLDREHDPEHIRLSDFGFATACKDSSALSNKTFCGTPEFMAPEVLHDNGKILGYNGQKADIWSAGVVTLEMFGVFNPFGGPSQNSDLMTIVRNIANKDFTPTMPTAAGVEEVDKDYIKSLLKRAVDERLSAAEAVGHPLFQISSSSSSGNHCA